MRQWTGRSWTITPLSVPCEHRIVGRSGLLSIALRVLVRRQCVAREHVQRKKGRHAKDSPPDSPADKPHVHRRR